MPYGDHTEVTLEQAIQQRLAGQTKTPVGNIRTAVRPTLNEFSAIMSLEKYNGNKRDRTPLRKVQSHMWKYKDSGSAHIERIFCYHVLGKIWWR